MGKTVALMLAAGTGSRMGPEPKAFLDLGGIPMLLHSYRAMAECGLVDRVILLVPPGREDEAGRWTGGPGPTLPTEIRHGGETRVASVRLGLDSLPAGTDIVVCHDAARPFASAELFRRVLSGLGGCQGVVPVVPSPDTVKRLRAGMVVETLPREELGLVQTPQAFDADALVKAHRAGSGHANAATDDAMLVEAAGLRVAAVEGDPANFKVTTPNDLRRAEWFLRELADARGLSRPGR